MWFILPNRLAYKFPTWKIFIFLLSIKFGNGRFSDLSDGKLILFEASFPNNFAWVAKILLRAAIIFVWGRFLSIAWISMKICFFLLLNQSKEKLSPPITFENCSGSPLRLALGLKIGIYCLFVFCLGSLVRPSSAWDADSWNLFGWDFAWDWFAWCCDSGVC